MNDYTEKNEIENAGVEEITQEDIEVMDIEPQDNEEENYEVSEENAPVSPEKDIPTADEITELFAEKKLGPRLISYVCRDKDYMVSESAVGDDALHYLDKPEALCEAICGAMKYLHSQAIIGVPRSMSMDAYDSNEGHKILKCDTLIHGDFCLTNVIFDKGKFSAFIDLGGAGVGDRHIDIFWLLWSLNYNLGTNKYADYVLDLYGRDKIDENALKFVAEVENLR